MYRGKETVREVTDEGATANVLTLILVSISCSDIKEPAWREILQIEGGKVDFKLDLGVDVTIILEATLDGLRPRPDWSQSKQG